MATCPQEKVLAALKDRGLWESASNGHHAGRHVAATYVYRDACGAPLYEIRRFHPKHFEPYLPGATKAGLNGAPLVLYRLPELMAAPERGVFVVEGERDADCLAGLGLIATTNAFGAGKWRAVYADALRQRTVYLLPDNDPPGRHHMQDVAHSLAGKAASLRMIELPNLPIKGDVSDWLDAGHTREELMAIIKAAPIWTPDAGATTSQRGIAQAGRARLYDLSVYDPESERAGVAYQIEDWLIAAQIHLTAGSEKLGKTTQAWHRAAAVSRGGRYLNRYQARHGRVLVATEMDAEGIRQLLEEDGIEPDWMQIRTLFLDDYHPEERAAAINDACTEWQPAHLILDPIDESLASTRRPSSTRPAPAAASICYGPWHAAASRSMGSITTTTRGRLRTATSSALSPTTSTS
jgi:5S rRNA maturation endonuclease (ribonuclease M5)